MIEYTGRWTEEDKEKLIEIIPTLTQNEIDVVNADFWNIHGRASQTPYLDRPIDSWNLWLLICGRGFGKSRAGVQWCLWMIMQSKTPIKITVVAATGADLLGTILTGPSGFLANAPKFMYPVWNRGSDWLTFPNGSEVRCYTSSAPERLRGVNAHYAWMDELAAWEGIEQGKTDALDQVMLSTRLPVEGGNKIICTTTPKNIPWLRQQLATAPSNPRVILTRGSSYDNADNLGEVFFENLKSRFEGTTFGQQEIYGDLVDLGGAKPVNEEDIQIWPVTKQIPECAFIITSLDPAFTEKTSNDPSAVWVLGVWWDSERHDYSVIALDAWSAHLAYPDLKDRMVECYNTQYGGNEIYPNVLIIEQKACGQSITQDLNRMDVVTRGYNPGRDDKFSRMSKAATIIQQHRFYVMGSFPGSKSRYASWMEAAMEEVCNFPSVVHDDYVDSLSQALIYLIDSGFVCEYPGRRPLSPDMLDKESRQTSSRRSGNPYSM